MSDTQPDLKKIAEKLSKISGDNENLISNINDILGYMDLLQEIDTTGVEPTVSVVEGNAILREDDLLGEPLASPHDLLACSKQHVVGGYLVLPNIMN